MPWNQLALFALSFIATAIFSPTPQIENRRAQEFDPESVPRATEDAPIPLLLGCARIKAPNTAWYGNFRARPLTEKVKINFFRSVRRTIGHENFLTLWLDICLGEAELKTLFIDREPVDPGITSAIQDNALLYTCALGGTERFGTDSPPAIEGSVCFPFDFSEVAPTSTTTFNVVGDMNLNTDEVDAGEVTVTASYDSTTSGSLGDAFHFVRITQFDGENGTGAQLVPAETNQVSVSQSAVDPVGVSISDILEPGCRSILVQAWGNNSPLLAGATITNAVFRANGRAIIYTDTSFDINEPELFGGRTAGGGWIGNVNFYAGGIDQVQDPHLITLLGSNISAHRNVSNLVFIDNNIGETPQLRNIEMLMGRITNNLNTSELGLAFEGSVDINPAEALWTIMTDVNTGMGIAESRLNRASFEEAAATLITEQHGCSVVVTTPQEGGQVIGEILRQIDGVFYQNQAGEIVVDLIRDDYDAGTLPVFDESDIVEVTSYQRTTYEDVISEVKVSYSGRDTDSSRVAAQQNDALIANLGLKTSEISFPFCYEAELANQLAARELSRLSVPLIRLTVLMNRSAYTLRVGQPIKITFPELGISELICRVQKFGLGELEDNRVMVELVQDVFAVNQTVFATPVNTGWVDTRPSPITVPVTEVVEMPRFFGRNLEEAVEDGFASVIPFALQPQDTSTGFTFNADVQADPIEFLDPEDVEYPVTALFTAEYDREAGFETGLDAAGFTVGTVTGTIESATVDLLRGGNAGLIYANGEWLGYEGVTDNLDDTFTLTNVRRAILGTEPVTHTLGSRLWFLDLALLGNGDLGADLLEDGTVHYKFLDQVGAVQRAASAETASSQAMQDIADRPARPRGLAVAASRVLPVVADLGSPVALTWVPSNREAEQIAFEDDASETADQAETFDVRVFESGVENVGLQQLGAVSGTTINLSGLVGENNEIRVSSRRTVGDLKSSFYSAIFPIEITGPVPDALGIDADTFLQSIYTDLADSTTSFTDQSIRGIPLLTTGGATTSGGELVLSASGDSLVLDNGDLDEFSWMLAGDSWTCEAWVIGRPDNLSGNPLTGNAIFASQPVSNGFGGGLRGIFLGIQNNGALRVFAHNGNGTNASLVRIVDATSSAVVPDDGLPHHVAFEWQFPSADTARLAVSIDGGAIEIFNEATNRTPTVGPVELQPRLWSIDTTGINYIGNVEGMRLVRGQHLYGMFDLGAGMTFTPTVLGNVNQDLAMDRSTPLTPERFLSSNWPELHAVDSSALYITEGIMVEGDSPNIMHCIYGRGAAHASTTDYYIEKLTSTDYGASWPTSSRVTVASDVSNAARNHAVIRDPSSGRITVMYRTANASDVTQDVLVTSSTDDGDTWSAPVSVNSQLSAAMQLEANRAPWGPGVVTSNGLCMPVYASGSCDLLFSSDGGATWGSVVTAYTGQTNYNEPSIISDGVDDVALVARLDSGGTRKSFGVFTSSDGGSTWGAITTATFPAGGSPTTANPYRLCNCDGTVKGMWCSRDQSDSGVYVTEMSLANFFAAPTEIITGTGNATRTQIATMPRWNTLSSGNNDVGYATPVRLHDRDYANWYADLNGGEAATGIWLTTI